MSVRKELLRAGVLVSVRREEESFMIFSIKAVLFSSKTLLHGTEQWQGPDRRVLTSWTPQISAQNHPYFNTTRPLSQQELDSYALSTYYGHYAIKQRRLKGMFQRHQGGLQPPLAPPQDPVEVESSDEEDNMPEMIPF